MNNNLRLQLRLIDLRDDLNQLIKDWEEVNKNE